MSAIKTCQQCGGLYTGDTPLCAGCYFARFAPADTQTTSGSVPSLSRAERRALERNGLKAAKRTRQQPFIVTSVSDSSSSHKPERPKKQKKPKAPRPAPRSLANQRTAVNAAPIVPVPRPTSTGPQPRIVPSPEVGTICPLCGMRVPPRQLLEHKQRVHGEKTVVPSPAQPHKENQWVSIVSGGLPSLGKNSR